MPESRDEPSGDETSRTLDRRRFPLGCTTFAAAPHQAWRSDVAFEHGADLTAPRAGIPNRPPGRDRRERARAHTRRTDEQPDRGSCGPVPDARVNCCRKGADGSADRRPGSARFLCWPAGASNREHVLLFLGQRLLALKWKNFKIHLDGLDRCVSDLLIWRNHVRRLHHRL